MRMSTKTIAAASAASLALLLTACGGGDGDGKPKGEDPAPASAAAAPDVKALSAAELEKLVVEQADLKGYQVQKPKPVEIVTAGDVGADKPACEPLAEIMSSAAPGDPGSSVVRKTIEAREGTATSTEDIMGALGAPVTSVTLGSYGGEGAQKAFTALKDAGTACGAGFSITASGAATKVSKLAPESVTAGDEALAWTVTSDLEGEPFTTKLVVFRKGNTLASFSTLSLSGVAKELPTAVIDAQATKLG
ncbi:hypothetical protein [Streptomyces sp. NBC_01216]|uniref:hypothetical protein n=1 Tax=unclassified Streptomyces TaxID=2593676 RepID=UPI002E0F1B6A|nr:hypothetical protein OG393_12090 [Streptomyces sp. NBC_01216]